MVKSMLKNGTSIFFQTQKTIISAASVLSIAYALSAVLSFVRTRVLSSYFGDSAELGVFFTADRVPSFIFSILIVGTVSSVFIPIFTTYLKKDEKEAWFISSTIINLAVITFSCFGILTFLFAPQIMTLLSLGKFSSAEIELGANLMRIMILAQVVLIVSSFVTSILQSFRFFLVPALAPIVYNLGMIFGIAVLSPMLGIYAPAVGVVIGSCFHLLIQVPMLRKVNFKHLFVLDLKDPGVREVLSLLPPRIFSSGINQVSVIIDNTLAILVSASSVVVFKFAEQLQTFPVNLFGVSISLAALPALAFESDDKDRKKFKETFLTSLHQMLFLVIPASIILLVLKIPIVRLVYGASKFSWAATLSTSYTLAFFSLSIFSQSAVYLMTRAFYALHDTKSPLKVVTVSIILDVLVSVFFIKYLGWGVWAIALSYTLVSFFEMLTLLYMLHKRVGGFDPESLILPFLKIAYSAVFMAISLYIPMKLLEKYVFDTTRTIPLIFLTLTATIFGGLCYLFFTKIFAVKEVQMLYAVVGKFRLRSGISAATDITSTAETKVQEENPTM